MGYQENFFTRIQRTFTAMAVGALLSTTGIVFAADTIAWDKTFPRSDKVSHEKGSFYSRDRHQGLGNTMSNEDEDRRKAPEEVA